MTYESNEIKIEKYILVAVETQENPDSEHSLRELKELVKTAGAQAVGMVAQKLPHVDAATYIGKGKAEELKVMMKELDANGIVCDDELSPAQIKNLSDLLDAKVIDRTILILDIFAAHARTNEGKIQVEMAQQKYRLSHLSGMGKSLSRLGGGIGTRGPGETKLETDRRQISGRIANLRREIREMEQVRTTMRKQRMENLVPVIAIVGYTNAGKSTLLNHLTGAAVLEEDKLFATLDPTTRECRLPGGQKILLTDTVGFIDKLPHHLVDAFRSTLEEAGYADMILHVVDGSDENRDRHMEVVYDTLHELKITGKPVLTVFNKCDLYPEDEFFGDPKADHVIRVSAKQEIRLEDLLKLIEKALLERKVEIEVLIPYGEMAYIDKLHRFGQILSEDYEEAGVRIHAFVPPALVRKNED